MPGHILLIGATLLDTKGKPVEGLEPGTSNPAEIKHARGGTARNVAENLGRLGAEVVLISAVGDDHTGRQLLSQTAAAAVNVEHVLKIPGEPTGSYIAILDNEGSLSVALDDVRVMRHVNPALLAQHGSLFAGAAMVMVDGSLTPEALDTAVRLSNQHAVPLCADPSSARLAHKLCPYLPALQLVVPNEVEAAALLETDFEGYDPDTSLDMAERLVNMGVERAVITLSDFGLVYATTDETGYIPARYAERVDSTGTGDAVTAAIIYGLVNGLPAIEAIRLGAAAGSLTLQTNEAVVPDLSLDMLYEHLIV